MLLVLYFQEKDDRLTVCKDINPALPPVLDEIKDVCILYTIGPLLMYHITYAFWIVPCAFADVMMRTDDNCHLLI